MVLGFKKGGQEYEKGGEGNQGMWSKVMACWEEQHAEMQGGTQSGLCAAPEGAGCLGLWCK